MSFVDEHYCALLRTLTASSQSLRVCREESTETLGTNSTAADSASRMDGLDNGNGNSTAPSQQKLLQRAFDISTQVLAIQGNGSQPAGLGAFGSSAAESCESKDSRDQAHGGRQFVDKRAAGTKIPPMASVISDLGLVREVCSGRAADMSEDTQKEAANIVLLNSIAAIHAHTIGQLLDTALPLSVDIDYWNSQDGGVFALTLYLVQSLPWRLAGWGSGMIEAVARLADGHRGGISGLGSALYSSISTKRLFPEVVLSSAKGDGSAGAIAMTPLLRVPRSANVLSLTRREIRYKLKRLEDAQDSLAAMIGSLSQAAGTNKSCPDEREARGEESAFVAMQQIEQVLCFADKNGPTDIGKPVHGPQALIGQICLAEELAVKAQTVSARFTQKLERFRRPSLIARGWLPALVFIFCARRLSSYIADNRESFKEWLLDGAATLQNYVAQYILAPLRSAYETIRYGKHSYRVVTEQSLLSDFKSLEDMVVGFARRFGNVDAADVRRRVECGDLSDVMQVYAREMQKPFKNAVFGDLVEAMLIQVQKVKVDVGQTMAALDKLLKSNELNFLLLSTVPATLSIYGAGRWVSSKLAWWTGGSSRHTISSIRVVVRDIDRLLNNCGNGESENRAGAQYTASAVAHGKLICFTHYLRHHAKALPDSGADGKVRTASGWVSTLPRTRTMFLQDVRDIESVALGNAQKRNVVDRMYRTFRFL